MADQLRAYRFALDLTEVQASAVAQNAGAARWAYNHALAAGQIPSHSTSATRPSHWR